MPTKSFSPQAARSKSCASSLVPQSLFALVLAALALLLSACASPSQTTKYPPLNAQPLVLAQDIRLDAPNCRICTTGSVQIGLKAGIYKPVQEDEHGIYYQGMGDANVLLGSAQTPGGLWIRKSSVEPKYQVFHVVTRKFNDPLNPGRQGLLTTSPLDSGGRPYMHGNLFGEEITQKMLLTHHDSTEFLQAFPASSDIAKWISLEAPAPAVK